MTAKKSAGETIIALAGNPNVGKSSIFNALTGLRQHTGNWPGKTVGSAKGRYTYEDRGYLLVDLPGTYSLMAHSEEEEVARDYLLSGQAQTAVVVCDATALERNLNLALQTMEIMPRVVVCVNLMDEAEKKGISVDIETLEKLLGVPVVATSARSGKGLDTLKRRIQEVTAGNYPLAPCGVHYSEPIQEALARLFPAVEALGQNVSGRWLSLRLLEGNSVDLPQDEALTKARKEALEILQEAGIAETQIPDVIAACLVLTSEELCLNLLSCDCSVKNNRDRRLDRLLTGKRTGIPLMLLLLCGILWLTISGANYPSQLLSDALFQLEGVLTGWSDTAGAPTWLDGVLILGVYRTLAWVVSVMLPPMAIFFPLFTLLEDFGYLPRVAFALDYHFKKACACGKQSLCMCMGLGCNAVGVSGCRIIDSPRERLIAILTNSFMPCNGRFPTLIALISMFFLGTAASLWNSFLSALLLGALIVLSVFLTFAVSRLLSKTLLKGQPSSFTLELPPYRTPQFGKVIVRSLLDRTLFVLGRAVSVAAPAGLILWILSNVTIGDISLLAHCATFLDPFAQLLGLDGIILLAFILGFPANEIVIPIIIMGYLSTGSLMELGSLSALKALLVSHGWTWATAISVMLFSLIHWPCSTTCLTIKKETGSVRWTVLSVLIPTVIGILLCFLFTAAVRMMGLA